MIPRRILKLTGTDAADFLQGLVTNDVAKLDDGLVYAAMLTPQGKYMADFFLARVDDGILIDVSELLADSLEQRLNMYKLRADVSIWNSGLQLKRGIGPAPAGALPDPRHPGMGWRQYTTDPASDDGSDWDAIRVANCIPETGIELTPDSFILEAGFEALHGVDFRKGCYVGQELTARMKHKAVLRKGLRKVAVSGSAPVGTPITSDGKPAGMLFTQSGGAGIAHLRLDRATGDMLADSAVVKLD